ncbi:MAG TPA: PIN domain-containing protein [Ktedonobacterales bacterium]|jgi:predicted nucleic acid-binding protein
MMASIKVLVDTNVVIDWLNDRKPWVDEARSLWESRETGLTELYLPTSVLTDIFYILRKLIGNDGAKKAIEKCVATFGLLPIDETVIRSALTLPGSDFEDNVQIACTLTYHIDLIVTRNLGDFVHGVTVPVIEPKDIVRYLPSARP